MHYVFARALSRRNPEIRDAKLLWHVDGDVEFVDGLQPGKIFIEVLGSHIAIHMLIVVLQQQHAAVGRAILSCRCKTGHCSPPGGWSVNPPQVVRVRQINDPFVQIALIGVADALVGRGIYNSENTQMSLHIVTPC